MKLTEDMKKIIAEAVDKYTYGTRPSEPYYSHPIEYWDFRAGAEAGAAIMLDEILEMLRSQEAKVALMENIRGEIFFYAPSVAADFLEAKFREEEK